MTDTTDRSVIEAALDLCEASIQYRFQDRKLLERCLTHSSIARMRIDSNERLEFLGDAVLGMIVCEMLFQRYPQFTEGELTRIKSVLVSRTMCARIAEELDLGRSLLLGKGLTTFDSIPASILAAVVESLVAGIYLDGGLEAVRHFVERCIGPHVTEAVEPTGGKNYKSILQQLSQKSIGETPVYRLLDEKGPDHSKCFQVAAVIGARSFPAAWGPNKKEAEQRAARNALVVVQEEQIPREPD